MAVELLGSEPTVVVGADRSAADAVANVLREVVGDVRAHSSCAELLATPGPFALVCLLASGPAQSLREPIRALRGDPRGRPVPLLVVGDAQQDPGLFELLSQGVDDVVGTRSEQELRARVRSALGRELARAKSVAIEERLAETQQELALHERRAAVAELAGATAHELNQPLTAVLGYAELVTRQVPDGTPCAEAAAAIVREADRMADIVRKIGKLTKYETKPYVGEAKIIDIDRSVDSDVGAGRR